jgi:polysaccharide deacetylase 2 family uncharacterized protein YibQ
VVYLLFLFTLTLLVDGCKKEKTPRLPAAQIRKITKEMAAAASAASASGTVVKIKQSGTSEGSGSADEIYIGLKIDSRADSQGTAVTKILQALGKVATREQLTQDEMASDGEALRLSFRHSGVVTQRVLIVRRVAVGPFVSNKTSNAREIHARLAIILDDLGSDRAAADAIFLLPYPLTISVLPEHAHSVDIAEDAHRRGYEVMLHLPMQSVGKEQPEKEELRPGMSRGELDRIVDKFLTDVPNVVGVNNHQGSQATADPALMNELMPVLRNRRLFYVDSRTTAATVAYDTAQRLNVHSGFRNVPFLDDVAQVAAVRKQLELAIRGAKEKGQAIAIGHPHPATLEALREVLPKLEAQGVQLVFASDLVH